MTVIDCAQRCSPRWHGLGLNDPRGQVTSYLALTLGSKCLALVLALYSKSLALDGHSSALSLDLGSCPTSVNKYLATSALLETMFSHSALFMRPDRAKMGDGCSQTLCSPSAISVCKLVSIYTVSQKKVPTFKLSVTLSNLNLFSQFLYCWKAYEICYKSHMIMPASP